MEICLLQSEQKRLEDMIVCETLISIRYLYLESKKILRFGRKDQSMEEMIPQRIYLRIFYRYRGRGLSE